MIALKSLKYLVRPRTWVFLFLLFSSLAFLIPYSRTKTRSEKMARKRNALSAYYVDPQKTSDHIDSALSEAACRALDQPYYYLGRGKQAVVFSSIDDQYVVKVFKWPTDSKKAHKLSTSLHIATQSISEETAILGASLTLHGKQQLPLIEILDKRGRINQLDLNKCVFVVQRKIPLSLKETLLKLRYHNKTAEAEEILAQIFVLLKTLRSKNIIDNDGSCFRNNNINLYKNSENHYTAFAIDIGRYSLSRHGMITYHDIRRLKTLSAWLEKAWPELVPAYQELEKDYKMKS